MASTVAPDQRLGRAALAESPSALRPLADVATAVQITVVVPLFNEELSLRPLYDELGAALDEEFRWEVVFVDDGSTDGSYRQLMQLHDDFDNVKVVQLRRNFGKAAALTAGFEQACGDLIVTIDADLQDDPAEIPSLVAKLEEGFDLVTGWKECRRDAWPRRVASRIYNRTTGWVTGVTLHDMNCGLKVYRAELARDLNLYGELHRYVPVLAHHRGFRVGERAVNHRPRQHGQSRYGPERFLRGFFDLLTVTFLGRYRYRPLHLFGGLGLAMGSIGSIILIYLAAIKIGGAAIGQRPLLMLGILLVVIGVQFFSLGLVGEMITSHQADKVSREQHSNQVRDVLL
jgi:glycosyltransferase involved in cell wall biosynthesis